MLAWVYYLNLVCSQKEKRPLQQGMSVIGLQGCTMRLCGLVIVLGFKVNSGEIVFGFP